MKRSHTLGLAGNNHRKPWKDVDNARSLLFVFLLLLSLPLPMPLLLLLLLSCLLVMVAGAVLKQDSSQQIVHASDERGRAS